MKPEGDDERRRMMMREGRRRETMREGRQRETMRGRRWGKGSKKLFDGIKIVSSKKNSQVHVC